MQTQEPLIPPTAPGQWTLSQIQAALSRPLPQSMLATRKQGNATIRYIPWFTANKILDKYAPGWSWEIRQLHLSRDRLFLVGRLTLPTVEGNLYREATGTEILKDTKVMRDRDGTLIRNELDRPITEAVELPFGDPSSNAESMAFRRAAAKFGLGLYLYHRD
jgi:hypothetical protein